MPLIEEAMRYPTVSYVLNGQITELVLDRSTLEWVIMMLETEWRNVEGSRAVVKRLRPRLTYRRPNPLQLDLEL